jgi:hypothetical protein
MKLKLDVLTYFSNGLVAPAGTEFELKRISTLEAEIVIADERIRCAPELIGRYVREAAACPGNRGKALMVHDGELVWL